MSQIKLEEFKEFFSKNLFLEAEKKGNELYKDFKEHIPFLRQFVPKANLNKIGEAKEIFLQLLKYETNPYMTLNNLGNIFYLQKDYDQATYYLKNQ